MDKKAKAGEILLLGPAAARGMQSAACLVLGDGGKLCKDRDCRDRASADVLVLLFWLLKRDLVFCTHMVCRSPSIVQAGDLVLGRFESQECFFHLCSLNFNSVYPIGFEG